MRLRARRTLALVATGALALWMAGMACTGDDPQVFPPPPEAGARDLPESAAPLDAAGSLIPDARTRLRCPDAAILCDDFEEGDLRRWGDPVISPALAPNTIVVDDAGPPSSGAFALHLTAKTNRRADGGVIRSAVGVDSMPFTALTSGTFAIRFFVKVSRVPSNGTSFVWLQKGTADAVVSSIYVSSGRWAIESAGGSLDGGAAEESNVDVPVGSWVCVEWLVAIGPLATGRHRLFVDDNPVPVLELPMNTLGRADAGYGYVSILAGNQGAQDQELFFDDVAVASYPASDAGPPPRIGCR